MNFREIDWIQWGFRVFLVAVVASVLVLSGDCSANPKGPPPGWKEEILDF